LIPGRGPSARSLPSCMTQPSQPKTTPASICTPQLPAAAVTHS